MRLAQLARKIAVKPSEIASFLASQAIAIEDSSNAKVEDMYVDLVLKHFAPELIAKEAKGSNAPIKAEIEETGETQEEKLPVEMEPPVAEIETSTTDDVKIPDEVIKPPKVELPGLKVVGKINLPEPKKKEEVEDEGQVEASEDVGEELKKNVERVQKPRRNIQAQERKPRKNLVALQREREQREALRKRLEEKEREKKLRTQRYQKKISKYTPPPRPLKKIKHEDEYEVYTEEKARPKSFIGKILSWFVSD